jgi:hypothetical protein
MSSKSGMLNKFIEKENEYKLYDLFPKGSIGQVSHDFDKDQSDSI